jgi:serine/threonine-protein kinase RsbT
MSAVARMASTVWRKAQTPAKKSAGAGAPLRVAISNDRDALAARREARAFATQLGFCCSEVTAIVAVVSELTRTVSAETSEGALLLRCAERQEDRGLELEAHFGSAGAKLPQLKGGELVGMHRSLTAVRRLVDAFEITSRPGGGTIVRVTKWMR